MSRRTLLPWLILTLAAGLGAVPAAAQTLYWESPRVLVPQGMASSSAMAGPDLMGLAWQEIQPRSPTDRTSGSIYLSVAVSHDGISWTMHPRFFGPIGYTGVTEGNEPRVYSMVIDSNNRILVAVSTSDRETQILQSTDEGQTFNTLQKISARSSTGVPNLYLAGDGGFLLFLSQGSSSADLATGSVILSTTRSRDGRTWSPLAPFVVPADRAGSPQIQPAHAALGGRDYVVFESLIQRSDLTSTWQLFMKRSTDGGATWENAVSLTSETSAAAEKPVFGKDPLAFDNERPRLTAVEDGLELVWERSPYGSNRSQIWAARLDGKSTLVGAPEIVAADTPARFGRFFQVRGTSYVIYEDGSHATSRIALARRDLTWAPQLLQNTDVLNALFPHAVQFNGSLFIFWENQASAGGLSSLVALRPLASVGAPVVKPVDFTPGSRQAATA